MIKRNMAMAIMGCIALGACGSKPGQNANGNLVREAGNWSTQVKLISIDIPGAPAEMTAQMQKGMAVLEPTNTCLTPEAAAQEDMAAQLSKGTGQNDCTFSKKSFAGGKIDIAGTCKAPTGGPIDMVMTGTVDAKKVDMIVKTSMASPMGAGKFTSEMNMVSTHTGACKG